MVKNFCALTNPDGSSLYVDPVHVSLVTQARTGGISLLPTRLPFEPPAETWARSEILIKGVAYLVRETPGQVLRELGFPIIVKTQQPMTDVGDAEGAEF
jgi:hypothetical protein